MSKQINEKSMLPVGTILDKRYRIDRYLSSGGFGNTYVATNIKFDTVVAIKEFFINKVSHREHDRVTVSVSNPANGELFEQQLKKFNTEAKRQQAIRNPHIVAVHDLFDENGTAYYVMDYIDGESLSERMKRIGKPLPEDEVHQYIPQILDALNTVHSAGLFHLDLKPSNVMVNQTGRIQLIDFGASKQEDKQGGAKASSVVCFTEGYAPVEQCEQNMKKFGPWTDIYALGATLYALLTNSHPPKPSDILDDDTPDKREALPFPSSVSKEMRDMIRWMMAYRRDDRPQSVQEIQQKYFKEPANPRIKEPLNTEISDRTIVVDKPGRNHVSDKSNDQLPEKPIISNPVSVEQPKGFGGKAKKMMGFIAAIIIGLFLLFFLVGTFSENNSVQEEEEVTIGDGKPVVIVRFVRGKIEYYKLVARGSDYKILDSVKEYVAAIDQPNARVDDNKINDLETLISERIFNQNISQYAFISERNNRNDATVITFDHVLENKKMPKIDFYNPTDYSSSSDEQTIIENAKRIFPLK